MGKNCDHKSWDTGSYVKRCDSFGGYAAEREQVLKGVTDLLIAFLYFVIIVINMTGNLMPVHNNAIKYKSFFMVEVFLLRR
jgi:hypothetical protein